RCRLRNVQRDLATRAVDQHVHACDSGQDQWEREMGVLPMYPTTPTQAMKIGSSRQVRRGVLVNREPRPPRLRVAPPFPSTTARMLAYPCGPEPRVLPDPP